jgi:hypothetical protein
MASRLSFLLWGSTPDEALLSNAAAGGLRTREEVRAAAEVLLADDRSGDVIRHFHLGLLALLDPSFDVGSPANPDFTPEIAALMQSETDAFIDDVTSAGPGGFAALFTAGYTFLNEPLATFYGITGVTGPELRKVTLSSPPYAGLLTQGSFLAANSAGGYSIPSLRGYRIAKNLFCSDVPPEPSPPSSVPPTVPAGLTTRERAEQQVAPAACAACHSIVDPPGFALEHFDQVGRYRETEAGKPIDAAATLNLGGEARAVNGAAELGQFIAGSPQAHDCYVRNWAAYAYGATASAPLDECSRAALADAFERSNGDVRALLLELTQTDAFLYRPLTEP